MQKLSRGRKTTTNGKNSNTSNKHGKCAITMPSDCHRSQKVSNHSDPSVPINPIVTLNCSRKRSRDCLKMPSKKLRLSVDLAGSNDQAAPDANENVEIVVGAVGYPKEVLEGIRHINRHSTTLNQHPSV